MNLQNAKVLFAAQYAAPYLGNFIRSLTLLEEQLKKQYKAQCAYLLPAKASQQQWADEFAASHTVYYSGDDKKLLLDGQAYEILSDFNPDIIYSHFEGYDLPMYNAVKQSEKDIRLVWHMHDFMSLHPNPLKAVIVAYYHFKHYGIPLINSVLGGGTMYNSSLLS